MHIHCCAQSRYSYFLVYINCFILHGNGSRCCYCKIAFPNLRCVSHQLHVESCPWNQFCQNSILIQYLFSFQLFIWLIRSWQRWTSFFHSSLSVMCALRSSMFNPVKFQLSDIILGLPRSLRPCLGSHKANCGSIHLPSFSCVPLFHDSLKMYITTLWTFGTLYS